jgi:hypothetical protein
MCNELPTANFLLPNWKGGNPNPKYCTTLGFIPKTKLGLAYVVRPTSWKGVQNKFSHTWGIQWILLLSGIKKQNSIYLMARRIGCNNCRGVFQKQFGKKNPDLDA